MAEIAISRHLFADMWIEAYANIGGRISGIAKIVEAFFGRKVIEGNSESASTVRRAILRNVFLSLAKTCSMGSRRATRPCHWFWCAGASQQRGNLILNKRAIREMSA